MLALPIDPYLPTLVEAVQRERGLVLVAEPGAGKTTRLPAALLEALPGDGTILVVEPRRLAARMAAARIAEERGERLGDRVGYRVRFDTAVSKRTRLELITEGILARRLVGDPELRGVAAVVFDELHERHLAADLALAQIRALRASRRPDLALVAMSATLDAAPVARFLEAPVHEVPGRTFPIEHRFADAPDTRPLDRQVRAAIVRLFEAGLDGDVLVFLPGAADIRRAMEACDGPAAAFGFDRVPLHGELPPGDQDRAVRRGPRPRVVFSTNVAETSLTLDGIVAVVDSGLARRASVSPWTGLGQLSTAPISQASATQRAGRAGRTRAGIAVHLYTAAELARRPERETPEIARADLTRPALAVLATGVHPARLEWLERPPEASLQAALTLLERLGATDGEALTPMGAAMLRLPVHPRLARVALEAARRGHPSTGATLAALLSERDIQRRGFGSRGKGPRDDRVGDSDLLERLDALERNDRSLDRRSVGLVRRVAKQIASSIRLDGIESEEGFDEERALLAATLAGFPDRVARRQGGRRLAIAGGATAELEEASVVKEHTLMVALDAEVRGGRARVSLASAVDLELLMEVALERIVDVDEARFDPERERVVGFAQLRYEGLLLEETAREPSAERAAEVLAEAALSAGVDRFLDADALEQLRRRVTFARRHDDSIPALDDAQIAGVLRELCAGRRSFAELKSADLFAWIRQGLGSSTLRRVDALAPTHVAIPGRARVAVNYEADRPPWIASRLQDFFGATTGPTVADGREPLVLHLLAPNKRAVQITTDLAGFWERHYDEVKKELRRRYARHSWPDDPATASPPPPRRRRR